jgi:hypothetical protein
MEKVNMRKNKVLGSLVAVVAVSLATASSTKAAIEVTFDPTDSNVSTGIYAFDLSGLTTTPSFNSVFELLNWTLIGNSATIANQGQPTGWTFDTGNTSLAEWFFQNTSGSYNGVFEVKATPDLHGSIKWNLEVQSPSSETANGTVNIPAVPEPGTMVAGISALGCAVVSLRRKFSFVA